MSLTPLHSVSTASAQVPAAPPLLGQKVAIALTIMGTFFLMVPLVIWKMHGAFPDQNVSIVLGVIGTILNLVSILLKARFVQTHSRAK
jgi:hypothetical protein